ncbi:hypothetical protein HDV06_004633 [Boothiomyces sp. JEL0866]|nr:hypothetical protein HDV06_004633 [Boothiomyces sp. JEL0866]
MAILPKSTSALVTLTTWTSTAQEKLTPIVVGAKDVAISSYQTTISTSKGIQSLTLAFVVSLALFSSVPISFFLGFAGISGAIILGVAGTGVVVVQGTLLAFGAFFLFWWLLGALFFAGLATFWFSAGYFGLKTAKKLAA